MTQDQLLLSKVDEVIFKYSYWIPRVTIPENRKWLIDNLSFAKRCKLALIGELEWEKTQEHLEGMEKVLDIFIDSTPPVRIGHPDEVAKEPTYLHGMNCECNWCKSKNEKELS